MQAPPVGERDAPAASPSRPEAPSGNERRAPARLPLLWRGRRRSRRRRSAATGSPLATLALALPMLLAFTFFAWWPLLRAVVLSFQQSNLVDAAEWVGFDNFRRVLDDPLLWTAVRNTAWFALLALVFGYPLPLLLAVLMGELRRGRGLYAGLAYLPVVIPPVASILLWTVFYDGSPRGTFNTILGWFHLGPYPWFQSSTWAMPSIVLLSTWSNAGATVIIYLAALTAVRSELYEAADMDGAGILRKVWHITLPQLRTVLFVTLILQVIGTFQLFTEPYLLTKGGPADSTLSIVLLLFRYAFGSGGGVDYGAAAALSLMLAAFLAIFTAFYFRVTRSWSNS